MKTQCTKTIWSIAVILLFVCPPMLLAKDRPGDSSQQSAPQAAPTQRSSPAPESRPASPEPARTETRSVPQPVSQPVPQQPQAQGLSESAARSRQPVSSTPAPTVRPETSARNPVPQNRPSVSTQTVNSRPQTIPQQTRIRTRPAEPSIEVVRSGQTYADAITSGSQRTPQSRTTTTASRQSASRTSIATPIGSNTNSRRTASDTAARSNASVGTTAAVSQDVIRTDRVAEPITARQTRSSSPAEQITTQTTGSDSSSSNYGFVYYGAASKRDRTAAADTTTDRSTSVALRQKTVEPIRVSVDTIQAEPQRVSADKITRTPERVNRTELTAKEDRSSAAAITTGEERITLERTARAEETTRTAQTASLTNENRLRDNTERMARPKTDAEAAKSTGSTETARSAAPALRQSDTGREAILRSPVTDGSSGTSSSFESRSMDDRTSRIVVNGDNNVIIQGDVNQDHPRPHVPYHRFHDIDHIRHNPYWYGCGSGFVFHWSSSSCGYVAIVPYYNWWGFTYYYPSYHRKYVFVSLGGCWPSYRYRRYYWYGVHPYYWYGADVIPASTYSDYNTYNTYNTYSTPETSQPLTPAETITVPDANYSRNKQTAPVDAPEFETAADLCFDHAVKVFEAGKYDEAVLQFREAVRLSPDDVVLPFTYAQALFAAGDYAMAASVLREVIAKIPASEPTVYYPRGLYCDEAVLKAQIAALEKAIANEPFSTDYQLLLGYQYLGLNELEKAAGPLSEAAKNPANADAAGKLTDLAATLENARQQQ